MRINGFRCDACCKEHLLDAPDFLRQTMILPTDWYLVNHGKFEPGKEPLMFCSVKCLADWAEKQITGLREVVPTTEEHPRWKDW